MNIKEAKEIYCNKFFRVLNDENRNLYFHPERHELLYISDICNVQDYYDLITNIEPAETKHVEGPFITVSTGFSIQTKDNLGASETITKYVYSTIYPCNDLEEITKEDYIDVYNKVKENNTFIINNIEKQIK